MGLMLGSVLLIDGPTVLRRLNWGAILFTFIQSFFLTWITIVGAVAFWRWVRA
jgi:hypothetical protein